MSSYEEVVEDIKNYIVKEKLNQKDIATELGVDPSTVSRWLSGAIKSQNMTDKFKKWIQDKILSEEDDSTKSEEDFPDEEPNSTENNDCDISNLLISMTELSMDERKRICQFEETNKQKKAYVFFVYDPATKKYNLASRDD